MTNSFGKNCSSVESYKKFAYDCGANSVDLFCKKFVLTLVNLYMSEVFLPFLSHEEPEMENQQVITDDTDSNHDAEEVSTKQNEYAEEASTKQNEDAEETETKQNADAEDTATELYEDDEDTAVNKNEDAREVPNERMYDAVFEACLRAEATKLCLRGIEMEVFDSTLDYDKTND